MYILGINSAYHDCSACLLHDGKLIVAAEEERFSRNKHAKAARVDNPDHLPIHAIDFCLKEAKISLAEVAEIGYSIDPRRRRRNSEFGDPTEPGDWGTHLGEEVFHRHVLRVPALLEARGFCGRFHWISHHLCHGASAYYVSGFDDAAVVTVDGIGETNASSIAHGIGRRLRVQHEVSYPNSIGFLWERISEFLGFSAYDACKIMALGAYATAKNGRLGKIVAPDDEHGLQLDIEAFRFRSRDLQPLEEQLQMRRRQPGEPLAQEHFALAAALQELTTDAMLRICAKAKRLTASDNLCLAGGVALNCVCNRAILEHSAFANLFIMPAANDAGTAIGAAYYAWHEAVKGETRHKLESAYLGPAFTQAEMNDALRGCNLTPLSHSDVPGHVGELLSGGAIVGWFQGRMEFGPRALGNRSVLADPRDAAVREKLNRVIKHRESFRPFAASVLEEEIANWFEVPRWSDALRYMLIALPARQQYAAQIPSAVHVDGTSRVQSVQRQQNPRYHRVIERFHALTGVPLVLNTSFNDSEPIVCTPHHAIETFVRSELDYLVLGDAIVAKSGVHRAAA